MIFRYKWDSKKTVGYGIFERPVREYTGWFLFGFIPLLILVD